MIRRLRLVTGLILFAYVTTHLMNHALGVISLAAMEAGRDVFVPLWRNLPASLLLYGALLVHLSLAFYALYRRRRFRTMPRAEVVQVLLGLAIPPLLIEHVLGTRLLVLLYDIEASYRYFFQAVFSSGDLWLMLKQPTVLVVAWVHGCMGLHFWLRLKRGYRRWLPLAYGAAVLLPSLALVGYWQGAGAAMDLLSAGAPGGIRQAALQRVDSDLVLAIHNGFIAAFVGLLVLTLLARYLRLTWLRRGQRVTVQYPAGQRAVVPAGTSILEASRMHGIPHASVCGGRGRCSTCRVRVGEGLEDLPEPSDQEARVLERISAPETVRLACQTRPRKDVAVTPLIPPKAGMAAVHGKPVYHLGEEREVAVLFADIRGFTSLAEARLPYDTVFLLNRYFQAMGDAVSEAGGHLDKFIGDGVMALFGLTEDSATAARKALQAARLMVARLDEMNADLAEELTAPVRIGIGIHIGPAIVGEMGYGASASVTAIGDTVNTASRLEQMTKDAGVVLIASETLLERAGCAAADFRRESITPRGRSHPLSVCLIEDLSALNLAGASAA